MHECTRVHAHTCFYVFMSDLGYTNERNPQSLNSFDDNLWSTNLLKFEASVCFLWLFVLFVSWLVDHHGSQGQKHSVSIYERGLWSNFSFIFHHLLCDGILKFNFAFFSPSCPCTVCWKQTAVFDISIVSLAFHGWTTSPSEHSCFTDLSCRPYWNLWGLSVKSSLTSKSLLLICESALSEHVLCASELLLSLTSETGILFIFLLHIQGSLGSVNLSSPLLLHIDFSNTLAIPEKKSIWGLYFSVFHIWVLYLHHFHPSSSLCKLPIASSQVHDLSSNYYCHMYIYTYTCNNNMLYAYICHTHILTGMILLSTKSISDICMYTGLGLTILYGRTSQGADYPLTAAIDWLPVALHPRVGGAFWVSSRNCIESGRNGILTVLSFHLWKWSWFCLLSSLSKMSLKYFLKNSVIDYFL